MRAWHMLHSRIRSLLFRGRRDADLLEELEFHLQRESERLQAEGVSPADARRQAVHTFGSVEPAKEACRDARGTAWLDNVVRDVRYACRSFLRAPLVALTIVSTVGLGLGLMAVVFTVLNAVVFRVDEVRSPHELFAVERQPSSDATADGFTRDEYDAMIRETAVFSDALAQTPDVGSRIDGQRTEGRLVTGNFFQVLGVSAASGRVLTPADDEPDSRPALVLSHRAWAQRFGSDPSVVGRDVRVNDTSFRVVGVTPAGFNGLEPIAAPDFWAPLSLEDRFASGVRGGEERNATVRLQITGRLKAGLSEQAALGELQAWDAQQPAAPSAGGRRPALALVPNQGTVPLTLESLLVYMPLFFAFGLILAIGCANVANLLLARSVARQREIGIRLAIGASRRRVVWQLLTENLLLALSAACLAFGVSRAGLNTAVYFLTTTFPPDLGHLRVAVPPADWRVVLFLIVGALVSTLLFALAPALQATRVELVRAIPGEVSHHARPGRARHALVAMQVTGAVLLLICAAILLRSSWTSATIEPGINVDGILTVTVLEEARRDAVIDALRSEAAVDAVGAVWPGRLRGLGGLPADAEGANGTSRVSYALASPAYFDVLGIDIVRGRNFTSAEERTGAVAIVSEQVARQLWPDADALGQILRMRDASDSAARAASAAVALDRAVIVVGVVRDVPGFRIGSFRIGNAGVYMPIAAEAEGTGLILHVRAGAERAQRAFAERLAEIDPNVAEVSTMQTLARAEAYLLGIPFWLTLVLGAIALLLTVSGLFSTLSYLVEQRTTEMGVRMALGANRLGIAAIVMWQSARPVGIGIAAGGLLAVAFGTALLTIPAAAAFAESVQILDPLAYAGSLVAIVAACAAATLIPAFRAARVNPIDALRQP